MDLRAEFDKNANEYLKFEHVEHPKHQRPDICAFLLLHEICGGKGDMVRDAQHDEIYLDTEPDELARQASEADITTLVRCGVRYSKEYECLAMFT